MTVAGISVHWPAGAPAWRLRAMSALANNGMVAIVAAAVLVLVSLLLDGMVVQDTWLALVAGREIADHGLPRTDALAASTLGVEWIDQQWLGHLVLYHVTRFGGLSLALGLHLATLFGTLLAATVGARLLGASPRTVALTFPVAIFAAPWLIHLRTQSLALPLFMAVYLLLVADSRRPSARVLLVVPLLIVWSNLHGSVLIAVALVMLHAALRLRARGVRRGAVALLLAAPATLVASPYGFALLGYYKLMLTEASLSTYVSEWKPSSLGALTAVFFCAAFAVAWLLGRHPSSVTRFELLALPLLIAAALSGVRNVLWFALALAIALPRLVEQAWPTRREASVLPGRRATALFPALAVAAAAAVATVSALGVNSRVQERWPSGAAAAISRAAGPVELVLADERTADWLLWHSPSLRGRVAYDARLELLTPDELRAFHAFRTRGEGPLTRCLSPYAVVVFGRSTPERRAMRTYVTQTKGRFVTSTESIVAIAARKRQADAPSCPSRDRPLAR